MRITEIAFDGQTFSAPELPKREPKAKKARPAEAEEGAELKAAAAPAKKKAGKKKAAAKKATKKKK